MGASGAGHGVVLTLETQEPRARCVQREEVATRPAKTGKEAKAPVRI